jgi:hypothetical protein
MSEIRPSVTEGSTILLDDYNFMQDEIAYTLGTGGGQSGYGQALASSQVSANSIIDDAHWDNLRTDLLKARQHQTGVDESGNLTDVTAGQVIDDAVITGYENFVTTVVNNENSVASNQLELSGTTSGSTGAWNGTKTAFITFSFSSADQARYFFNSGGFLRFSGVAGVNGGNSKDQTWWNMTSPFVQSVGNSSFSTSFYDLTNNYLRIVSATAAAGVYVENRYYIDVACNVANNTNGGATSVTVRFIFLAGTLGKGYGLKGTVQHSFPVETSGKRLMAVSI